MMTYNGKMVTDADLETGGIPKFGGTIYYVSKTRGADTNDGLTPDTPFETIGVGITAMSDGDALNIMAGIYVELNIELSNDYAEMWFESGVQIVPASGTDPALELSGTYCRLRGILSITPQPTYVGLLVSGTFARGLSDFSATILTGGTGLKVTGSDSLFYNVACGGQTIKAFDIQADRTRLYEPSTVGIGASFGYYINNEADTGVLRNATSVGHTDGGYYIGALSINWSIVNCLTGGGDGRWKDEDNNGSNVWDIHYDTSKYKRHSFSGAGAGSENLFKITGTVNIYGLHCDVEVGLSADVGDVKYEMIEGANDTDITDTVASASAPTGSYFAKEKKSADALTLYGSGASQLIEETDLKKAVFAINAIGATTYIRFTWSGTATTGTLHHHCEWEPLSDNGFVEEV